MACGDDDDSASTSAATQSTAAAVTTAAVTTAAPASTSTTIGAPITVRLVTSTPSVNNLMHYTAVAFDEFARHGVKLELAPVTTSSAVNIQTLLAGGADVALIGTSGMLGAIMEGKTSSRWPTSHTDRPMCST